MPDWRNALGGGLIYAGGDGLATWITGEFQILRTAGIFMLGSTLYAAEICAYFRWLDQRFQTGRWHALLRAVLAQAFFNPVWIARHFLFIRLFSSRWESIDWQLLMAGWDSFIHVLPVGLLINYWIQNGVPLTRRFFAGAAYSALMAVYFAMSEVWFD